MKKLFTSLFCFTWLIAANLAQADEKRPYDEMADAKAAIEAALKSSASQNKSTLLVFGANWCGDCKVLDMEMRQGELVKLVNARLNVVKIDTGRNDNNTDLIAKYGGITKKGIPAVVLLNSAGKVAYQTDGGELANARRMGSEGITRFFTMMLESSKP